MSKSSSSGPKVGSESGVHEGSGGKDLKPQDDIDNVEEDALLPRDSSFSSTAKAPENSSKEVDKKLCEACCEPRMRTVLITHVNVCLYATCFWIQIGVLPVSMILLLVFSISNL